MFVLLKNSVKSINECFLCAEYLVLVLGYIIYSKPADMVGQNRGGKYFWLTLQVIEVWKCKNGLLRYLVNYLYYIRVLSVCMSVCLSQKVFNVQQKMKHHNIRCGQAEELQVKFFFENPRWPPKIQNGRQNITFFAIFSKSIRRTAMKQPL